MWTAASPDWLLTRPPCITAHGSKHLDVMTQTHHPSWCTFWQQPQIECSLRVLFDIFPPRCSLLGWWYGYMSYFNSKGWYSWQVNNRIQAVLLMLWKNSEAAVLTFYWFYRIELIVDCPCMQTLVRKVLLLFSLLSIHGFDITIITEIFMAWQLVYPYLTTSVHCLCTSASKLLLSTAHIADYTSAASLYYQIPTSAPRCNADLCVNGKQLMIIWSYT